MALVTPSTDANQRFDARVIGTSVSVRKDFALVVCALLCFPFFLLAPCHRCAAQNISFEFSRSADTEVISEPVERPSELERLRGQLVNRGIESNFQGLQKFLEEIHPSQDQNRRARDLIARLGSASFEEREQATQQLFRMPALPVELLAEARQSADPEISWRASKLLELGQSEFSHTVKQVFRLIRIAEVQGLSRELVGAIPLLESTADHRLVREALSATYRAEDADYLLSLVNDPNPNIRLAVVTALADKDPETHQVILSQIVELNGQDENVQLAALEGLANLGNRKVLDHLTFLMDSTDTNVRVRSSAMLRQLTGQSFRFAAYSAPEKRTVALDQWKAWVAEHGETAELFFPLDINLSRRSYLNGNTLLAMGYNNRVIEIDPEGNEVMSFSAQGVWMAERLESGNTLVAAYSSNKLQVFSPSGEVVLEIAVPSILSARSLPNGNFLVGQHSANKVQELTRDGTVVWEYGAANSVCDAIRMEDGSTLVASGNDVLRISVDKEVLWKYTANQIYGISVTDTNTILISQLGGSVIEVDLESEEKIWEFDSSNPVDAIRLPNGNTLITANNEFLEVTPSKEVIWRKPGNNYGSARR